MGKNKTSRMKTLKQAGQSFPKRIKKSKFIASAYIVQTEEEARNFIERIAGQHNKATHNAFAYRILRDQGIIINSNDDGEPRGTAGGSILFVIEKQNLVDVIFVVTRYYGGIKLGKGGLTRAYSTCTSELIKILGTTNTRSEKIS